MAWNKPFPNVDEDIAPFWTALKRHEFMLFRCKKCGAWYWPAAFCRFHDNEPLFGDLAWTSASGRGRIFAFNIHHRAFLPGFAEDVPYPYALIELDEGPMFGTRIVGCAVDEVSVGMAVQVHYHDISDDFTLPYFQPIR